MKRCPKHYWFEYDETLGDCVLCERQRAIAEAAATNPPQPLPTPAPGDHVPVNEPPPAFMVADPAPLAWGTDASPSPDPDSDGSPPSAPPPAPPSPSPDYSPAEFPPAPPPADIAPGPHSGILNQLAELRRNGVFTVVVIGFFAGGKTWFLNRVKHELGARFSVVPPAAHEGDPVTRTFEVEIHQALRLRDEKVRSFALVDIPGEMLSNLVSRDFRSALPVIEAMKMCGALIIALPADEVLLSEDIKRGAREAGGVEKLLVNRTADNPDLHRKAERARDLVAEAGSVEAALSQEGRKAAEVERLRGLGDNLGEADRPKLLRLVADLEAIEILTRVYRLVIADNDLTRFTQDLCFMTGLLSLAIRMEGNGGGALGDGAAGASAVQMHMTSPEYLPFKRPTFVAMTKADLVSDPDPLLAALIKHSHRPRIGIDFDEDPLDTVRDMRPSLATKLPEWFQLSKFDFVTAFHGHRDQLRIDYSVPCYGVGAVLNWISWAQKWDDLSRSDRAAMARARALRRSRDGDGETFVDDLDGILDRKGRRA